MRQTADLSSQIEQYLPRQLLDLVKDAGRKVDTLGHELYLVGGVVRDLFLNRPNLDFDLVVEGDAIELARELANSGQASLITHTHFGTAKLCYASFSLDLTTARRETYARPGVLPTVQRGSITDDLFRRDFSINAMALRLTHQRFGELIDPYKGKEDLDNHLIRVLHPKSFIDDATRILRALRYEQRLKFELEPETAKLLRHDVPMLDTITGDRLRHELELIMKENRPEQILRRAGESGVIQKLHPSLKGNEWLAEKFDQARQWSKQISLYPLYLCLLIYNLTEEENEQFLSHLNFPKKPAQAMRQTLYLKTQLHNLDKPHLKPSDIYQSLHTYTSTAIQTNLLASESLITTQRLQSYLSRLRYVKSPLTGEDLMSMGVPPGPEVGNILKLAYDARLNEEIKTKEQAKRLIRSWRRNL